MQDDVRPWLADSDLFVLPSLSEGISITLLEAMAAGLPAVATDVGGNREVIRDGETGLLVPVEDAAALASAMLSVLTDPVQARRMGAAGRERVDADFNINRTVAAYEQAYIELLGTRGTAPRVAA
jgi:glycosyltransferase involved in cell wall biosynthesis